MHITLNLAYLFSTRVFYSEVSEKRSKVHFIERKRAKNAKVNNLCTLGDYFFKYFSM